MPGDSLELLLTRLHGDAQLSRSKQKEFAVKHKQPLKSIAPKIISYKGVRHIVDAMEDQFMSTREDTDSGASTPKTPFFLRWWDGAHPNQCSLPPSSL